jgi:truncated hemoglobin YjbI
MLVDPKLGRFLGRVDINGLADHQAVFLSMVMGGPRRYASGDVQRAHVGLGIGHEEFETSIDYLTQRLQVNGFDDSDIETIITVYRHYEPHVTGLSNRG